MVVVHSVSRLFPDNTELHDNSLFAENAEFVQPTVQQSKDKINNIIDITKANQTNNFAQSFPFEVNVIYEEEHIENICEYEYIQCFKHEALDTTNIILLEFNKRKCKIKYKRIFCLCFIKQKIKRLTAKKMAIKKIKRLSETTIV